LYKENANRAESAGDAQEKLVRRYELEFAPKLKIYELQMWSSLWLTVKERV